MSLVRRTCGAGSSASRLIGLGAGGDGVVPAAVGFVYVDRDQQATHGRMWRCGWTVPGSATLVRPMAVESGRSVLRAANPGRPGMEATRANETTIRAVVSFVGRAA